MKAVTGIFASFEQARQSAEELTAAGIPDDRINFLTPGASAAKIDSIPSTGGEQHPAGSWAGHRHRTCGVGATGYRWSDWWRRRRRKFGKRANGRVAQGRDIRLRRRAQARTNGVVHIC